MKKIIHMLALALALITIPTLPLMAANTGHGGHKGHDHAKADEHQAHGDAGHGMDHSGHTGVMVHESMVDGYKLAWHLIDVKEKMAGVKGMEHITHHMMVYITDGHGNAVESAKVGYLIETPAGTKQKAMCMGMGGGFGADVGFMEKGTYSVMTKAVIGDKKLKDTFEYKVE